MMPAHAYLHIITSASSRTCLSILIILQLGHLTKRQQNNHSRFSPEGLMQMLVWPQPVKTRDHKSKAHMSAGCLPNGAIANDANPPSTGVHKNTSLVLSQYLDSPHRAISDEKFSRASTCSLMSDGKSAHCPEHNHQVPLDRSHKRRIWKRLRRACMPSASSIVFKLLPLYCNACTTTRASVECQSSLGSIGRQLQ